MEASILSMPGSSGALFFVWLAICSRRDAPADNSGEHDDRKQVWQPGEEVVIEAWIGLLDTSQERAQVSRWGSEADCYTDRLGSHEEERTAERAQRCPTPKDHCGQGNEPATGGHVVLEGACGLKGKISTGQAGEHTSHQNVPIPKPDDVNADSVGCLWVLPDSTRP